MKRGFTLIELMVVIAIVATLAASAAWGENEKKSNTPGAQAPAGFPSQARTMPPGAPKGAAGGGQAGQKHGAPQGVSSGGPVVPAKPKPGASQGAQGGGPVKPKSATPQGIPGGGQPVPASVAGKDGQPGQPGPRGGRGTKGETGSTGPAGTPGPRGESGDELDATKGPYRGDPQRQYWLVKLVQDEFKKMFGTYTTKPATVPAQGGSSMDPITAENLLKLLGLLIAATAVIWGLTVFGSAVAEWIRGRRMGVAGVAVAAGAAAPVARGGADPNDIQGHYGATGQPQPTDQTDGLTKSGWVSVRPDGIVTSGMAWRSSPRAVDVALAVAAGGAGGAGGAAGAPGAAGAGAGGAGGAGAPPVAPVVAPVVPPVAVAPTFAMGTGRAGAVARRRLTITGLTAGMVVNWADGSPDGTPDATGTAVYTYPAVPAGGAPVNYNVIVLSGPGGTPVAWYRATIS